MSTITFADVVEKKLSDSFTEFKAMPELSPFVSNGVPVAIAAYLASDMYENDKTESELVIELTSGKLMRFGLKSVKKGDSIAFIPEFDLLDIGKEYINSDEISFDNKEIVELSRKLSTNRRFIECLNKAYGCNVYTNGEWVDASVGKDENSGLSFEDEDDIALVTTFVFMSIMEILCNNKEASGRDISYTVPGLGEFTVKAVKDGYTVSLVFDKEFKSNCKNDALAEKLVDKVSE